MKLSNVFALAAFVVAASAQAEQRQTEMAAQSAESFATFMDNQHRLQERLSGQV
ncbi:MAG: hypothetical protein WDO72_12210 [Pseudomonadota bacterium]